MANKAEESKQKYFFDKSALLARYLARESGVRKINEIFTSYAQIYTSGLIFGEVVAELKKSLDGEKAETILPLLLGDVKSGRLKVLETKPGPVDSEVAAIREIQAKFPAKPLDIFELAFTRLYLKELKNETVPVFVSVEKSRAELMKALGHETLVIEEK